MDVKISKSDQVAEKFGIIHFCVNCNNRISITQDEADFKMTVPFNDKNLWIHDNSNRRTCYGRQGMYAFPRKQSLIDGIENG